MTTLVGCYYAVLTHILNGVIAIRSTDALFTTCQFTYRAHLESLCLITLKLNAAGLICLQAEDVILFGVTKNDVYPNACLRFGAFAVEESD